MDKHHLLEIILWPNGDGTYRKILNSRSFLKELGIYDDYKMTMLMSRSDHTKLHYENRTDEVKNKMCGAMSNKHHTYLSKMKISKSHKGLHHTDEQKKKISAAMKGKRIGSLHPMFGKHQSEESKMKISKNSGSRRPEVKEKLSLALKGRHKSEETKQRMHEANKIMRNAYNEYKIMGGELKWNEWKSKIWTKA